MEPFITEFQEKLRVNYWQYLDSVTARQITRGLVYVEINPNNPKSSQN